MRGQQNRECLLGGRGCQEYKSYFCGDWVYLRAMSLSKIYFLGIAGRRQLKRWFEKDTATKLR